MKLTDIEALEMAEQYERSAEEWQEMAADDSVPEAVKRQYHELAVNDRRSAEVLRFLVVHETKGKVQ